MSGKIVYQASDGESICSALIMSHWGGDRGVQGPMPLSYADRHAA